MQKLATTALQSEPGHAAGSLNDQQSQILLRMQASASQAVLNSVQTIGMIAAQDAINAAINVLKQAVNTAVGLAIL
jgi:hypothetical protein